MMNTESGAPSTPVLKTDALGRVRTPLARRQQLLDEFERSGLSGAQFAEFVGIKYQTFAVWVQQRRRQRARKNADSPKADEAHQMRWMEAVLEQAQTPNDPGAAVLVLQLPGGAQVELRSARQMALAASLVRALEQPPLAC